MSKNDGGPAFPTIPLNSGYDHATTGPGTGSGTGLSLRDYFAAKAMAGIFANPKLCDVSERQDVTVWVSQRAYQVADAMLATRDE